MSGEHVEQYRQRLARYAASDRYPVVVGIVASIVSDHSRTADGRLAEIADLLTAIDDEPRGEGARA